MRISDAAALSVTFAAGRDAGSGPSVSAGALVKQLKRLARWLLPGYERIRAALPGVRLCIACQEKADAEVRVFSGYNRRGSKDSQLR